MAEIKLTKGKVALVDDSDFEELSKRKWHLAANRYAARRASVKGKTFIVYMHRQLMGTPSGMDTDHINGDTLDNRRENLRVCTHQQNMLNWDNNKGTTSKYRGVSWSTDRSRWVAQIHTQGKTKLIGRFKDEIEAAKAYDKMSLLYFGEFARLNFEVEND